MDVPTVMTPTQLVLICILLTMLLSWMVIFAWLALRPDKERNAEVERMLSTAVRPAPIPHVPVRLRTIAHAQPQMGRPDTAKGMVLERSAEAIQR